MLYPSSRSPLCISLLLSVLLYNVKLIKFQNMTREKKTWVKISKSYATTQVHSPREGREALRQKVQILWIKI